MYLFYTPNIQSSIYCFDREESAHCVRVLRLKPGNEVHLTDGKGNLYIANILNADIKGCSVEIVKIIPEYGKRDFKLHIGIAPTKNIDRFEWFLEKATEIGIDIITPVFCEHSERTIIKPDRLNKIITSAVKQSLKAYHPILEDAVNFKEFIKKENNFSKFIAHCKNNEKTALKSIYKKSDNALILIGPEGDFSPSEIELALENNFKAVSLGNSRLRTETAGIVACHSVNFINEQ